MMQRRTHRPPDNPFPVLTLLPPYSFASKFIERMMPGKLEFHKYGPFIVTVILG
jgi:hypothetical protein